MTKKKRALFLPLGILLVCGFYAYLATELPSRQLKGIHTVGPSFLPWVIVISTALLALLELIAAVRHAYLSNEKPREDAEGDPVIKQEAFRNVGIIVCFFLFIALMPTFGFLPMSIIFLAATMLLIGGWNWLSLIAIPPLVGFLFYFIFAKALMVPLP